MQKLLSISMKYEAALSETLDALNQMGLQTKLSFDLNAARSVHSVCECPHHGTDKCDCQMGIVLVYGQDSSPATMVAHGRDGFTQIHLVDSAQQRPDPLLELNIRKALAVVGKMYVNQ